MKCNELKQLISSGKLDATFMRLYGETERAAARYRELADGFAGLYGGDREITVVSAPGRTEIGGNHTDHNYGRVLVAAVQLDVIAAVSKNGDGVCRVKSKGFPADEIRLDSLEPRENEQYTSAALIRGVAKGLADRGYAPGGFDAYTLSDVIKGSGVSSSAAFEVLIAETFSALYNGDTVSKVEQAKISQFAENRYFGKPSGLMDQLASAVGGFTGIDFGDPANPVVTPVDFDFDQTGYKLCIVDTGGSHADLTGEYAAICGEMAEIAGEFGAQKLNTVRKSDVLSRLPELRKKFGDRAVMRALHYFGECVRAAKTQQALCDRDFPEFLRLVTESGYSSFCFLQNAYPISTPKEQGVSLGLALTADFLDGQGAYRLHGGGFGGTIQAYVPDALAQDYKVRMESVFGANKCYIMKIRPDGSRIIA